MSRQGWSEAVCWRCGGEADPSSAHTLEMFGDRKRPPDAMGLAVTRSRGALRIRVTVPRCRNCRRMSRGDAFAVLCGLAAGGAVLAGGYRYLWQQGRLPEAFPSGDDEFTLWVAAFVGAFAGALLAFVVRYRRQRREQKATGVIYRSYDDFPPIAALLAKGWTWPSSE